MRSNVIESLAVMQEIYFDQCVFLLYLPAPHQYVRWTRDNELIADSRYTDVFPPPRVTLFNNGSLQVRSVNENDTAEYLCEVMTSAYGLESQLHAIEVQCN